MKNKRTLLRHLGDWRRLTRTFLTGLFVLLPIMVTLAIVMWLIGLAETVLGSFIRVLLPGELYLPGMGLVVSLLVILLVGLLMQAIFFRELVTWLEDQLERIPLIKKMRAERQEKAAAGEAPTEEEILRRSGGNIGSGVGLEWIRMGRRYVSCLLYTSPSPRDGLLSRMPSSA